jgi:hypothetical protein
MNLLRQTALIALATSLPFMAEAKNVLQFETMYGVEGKFLNTSVRGVKGDDLPWEFSSIKGSLSDDGTLTISVKGLVIPSTEAVPETVRGINPDANFRGVVSCLTEAKGTILIRNVMTANVPASREGDAEISEKVELPRPCIAPVVFVTGTEGDWFSVTGVEKNEDPQ